MRTGRRRPFVGTAKRFARDQIVAFVMSSITHDTDGMTSAVRQNLTGEWDVGPEAEWPKACKVTDCLGEWVHLNFARRTYGRLYVQRDAFQWPMSRYEGHEVHQALVQHYASLRWTFVILATAPLPMATFNATAAPLLPPPLPKTSCNSPRNS